jgi:SAM-dependent methyltransferase
LPPTSAEDREYRRRTFDEVAEQYDRARPAFPAELFDDLVSLAGLASGARVVEIGCGTGRATLPLAERGLDVVCVELGERLAAIARRKLARFPNVEVVVGAFETWEPPPAPFDAVVSFEAFHWLDPDVAIEKSHRVLREDGVLAVGGTVHVLPEGGDTFWAEAQEDYDAVVPSPDNRPPPPEDVDDLRELIDSSGRFRHVLSRRYPRDVEYSADEYVALMGTYSPNIALDADTRARLFERIRRRIEARPGGKMTAHYLFMLNLARRL